MCHLTRVEQKACCSPLPSCASCSPFEILQWSDLPTSEKCMPVPAEPTALPHALLQGVGKFGKGLVICLQGLLQSGVTQTLAASIHCPYPSSDQLGRALALHRA